MTSAWCTTQRSFQVQAASQLLLLLHCRASPAHTSQSPLPHLRCWIFLLEFPLLLLLLSLLLRANSPDTQP
jgi:hypothetical protein